jgi:hypothetical protein
MGSDVTLLGHQHSTALAAEVLAASSFRFVDSDTGAIVGEAPNDEWAPLLASNDKTQ